MAFLVTSRVAGALGDNIDTDVIYPARYLTLFAPDEVRKHLFEDIDPGLAGRLAGGGTVIGGANFGCGSAREQGLTALKYAGVSMLVCKSYSRAFYRNGINNAVPLFIADCPEPLAEIASLGDDLEADFETGALRNVTTGKTFACSPTPAFILDVLRAGGIFNYWNQNKDKERA